MTKIKPRLLLDFIPLLILTVYAIILIKARATNEINLQWKHIAGLILLPINYLLFWWCHKVGVIGLGLTLLIGLLGLLSYSPAITISTYYWTPGELKIPIFYGQPIFVLWLLVHFIISGRYYIGILTKKYWQELFNPST